MIGWALVLLVLVCAAASAMDVPVVALGVIACIAAFGAWMGYRVVSLMYAVMRVMTHEPKGVWVVNRNTWTRLPLRRKSPEEKENI